VVDNVAVLAEQVERLPDHHAVLVVEVVGMVALLREQHLQRGDRLDTEAARREQRLELVAPEKIHLLDGQIVVIPFEQLLVVVAGADELREQFGVVRLGGTLPA
jgi:hypothetical protein